MQDISDSMNLGDLKRLYLIRKSEIESRFAEFKRTWEEGRDEDIFAELAFCLLAPQSKAKICWRAIEKMCKDNVLLKGNKDEIVGYLRGVRFKNNKAVYIANAREMFMKNGKVKIKEILRSFKDPREIRDWLVKNVKGMGYKEASHFLRNIGMGEDFAILDRHILKNLKVLGIIDSIPRSMTKKRYMEIEGRMRGFSREIGIPMSHLDLLFWSKETGEVFK